MRECSSAVCRSCVRAYRCAGGCSRKPLGLTSSSFRRVSLCASALLLCFALLCFVSRFLIAFLCFAVGTESEEENRKRSKGSLGGGVNNDSKTLPESSQNPPKMAPGSLPGSLRRHLGAIWRRRWLPGALRGPSEGVPGASWVALGASGGAPGVLLASLGPLRRRPGHPPGGHFGLPGVLFARSAEK